MKPPRSPRYLEFVRSYRCVVPYCGAWPSEAHHYGPRGLSQTASDYHAIPLCADHHTQAPDSIHQLGPRKFQAHHQIDIAAVIRKLHEEAGALVPDEYRSAA
jgi:hypothetical protein